MAGYTPEHDVNGISDPFLQVCFDINLNCFWNLGKQNGALYEALKDVNKFR